MPLHPFFENQIDIKAFLEPVLHHAAHLELDWSILPRTFDRWILERQRIDMLHMVPCGTKIPIISKTVPSPTGASRYGICEGASFQHYQGSACKIFEIPLCNHDLIFINRM